MGGDLFTCRALLRAGSKSFSAASRLLPSRVRDSATVLYAFCRVADDLVDVQNGGSEAVLRLRLRLDDIYAGRPQAFATDRALASVVERHSLPRGLLDALIEGFEWDAQNRRYATLLELEDYAARVAGTIGAMMSVLMGTRTASALARACDLGVAMQLTNIARDVGEDARAGRLYLPMNAMREAGIEPECWLADPQINDGLRSVVRDLLRRADELYLRVDGGIAQLDVSCRPGIHAARSIYAEIGRVVARSGYDSVSRRAVVPGRRKAWLLLKSFSPRAGRARSCSELPLASTRFLVDCVASSAPAASLATGAARQGAASRVLWLIDLFDRMERLERERLGHRGHRAVSVEGFSRS